MGLGDWIFIAVMLVLAALGAIAGFGRVFKLFFGNKIVAAIISIVLCYCYGSIILDIPFVNRMLSELAEHWSHIDFFVKIHLEIIIYYAALFIVAMLLWVIIVFLVKYIAESEIKIMKVINRVGGAVFAIIIAITVLLLLFQLIAWIGGNTASDFESLLAENCNGLLRPVFVHNPMNLVVEIVKGLID